MDEECCPDCGNEHLVEDSVEIWCPDCGLVLGNLIIMESRGGFGIREADFPDRLSEDGMLKPTIIGRRKK